MPRLSLTTSALTLSATIALAACGQQGGGDKVARGKYLVTIAACGDCHTPGALMGKPDTNRLLGGSDVGFGVPGLGVFYPSNLTPDPETGIGKWTEDEIVTALRTGKRPDGRELAPVMPWMSLASLTDDDAHAIATYLKSLPPTANKVPGPFGPSEKPTAPYQDTIMPETTTPAPTGDQAPPATPQ